MDIISNSVIYLGLAFALIIYITTWFVLANYLKRIDIIDMAWALGFLFVAFLSLLLYGSTTTAGYLAVLFVAIWSIRLFLHILSRIATHKEDKRYAYYRKKWGAQFWQNTYTNIYLVQAVLILLVSTAPIAIITSNNDIFLPLAIIGFVVWGFGIVFESVADYQLRRFVQAQKFSKQKDIMDTGLWKYSRHPNYFGEITTWLGASIVAVSLAAWWGLLSFIVITLLITKISGIPPIERQRKNDKAYQVYKKHTSVLIPLPPKS